VPLNRGLQEFIDSEPELEPFEGIYLRAFWRLITERRGGPVIPYSEIEKYAARQGLDSDMIETFCEVIWSLDRAHTDWARAEQKRAQ
tara:strand:+ start:23218 stop:23478 length:261 start_codon:yes stop_codon:yes gene_type:complete